MNVHTIEATPPSLRELVAQGHRLAGADPEEGGGYADVSSPAAGADPPTEVVTGDQPGTETAPVADGTSGTQDEPGVLESFRLEDIEDPDMRGHVERYVKQVQGDYTRKTQEVARARHEAQQAIALAEQLQNPETRLQALDALGLEIVSDDDEITDGAPPADLEGLDPSDPVHAELLAMRQWREQQEATAQQREQAAAQAQQEAQVLAHVDDALDTYAESIGKAEDGLPDHTRRRIIAMAATAPRQPNGLPDMDVAVAEYEAIRAEAVQDHLAKLRGGDAPTVTPDLSGSSGQPQFTLRDDKDRLAAMNAVAERALARHA
jgi:hypothetical protein